MKLDNSIQSCVRFFGTIIIGLSVITDASLAAFTTYDNKSGFLAAAPFVSLESFESLPVDNVDLPSHQMLTLPDLTLSHPDVTALVVYDIVLNPSGGHPTNGTQYVRVANASGSGSDLNVFDISFSQPSKALGLYITDAGDSSQVTSLTYNDDLGNEVAVADFFSTQPDDGELFFGIVSDAAFSSARFANSVRVDGFAIDEVYYAVPEPSAVCILVLSLTWLMLRRREQFSRF